MLDTGTIDNMQVSVLQSELTPTEQGASTYRKTKRVKDKAFRQRAAPSPASNIPARDATESDSDVPSPSLDDAPINLDAGTEAHIDFAHGIKLGIHKE
eukprot:3815610-Rhodomonas_salina.1